MADESQLHDRLLVEFQAQWIDLKRCKQFSATSYMIFVALC